MFELDHRYPVTKRTWPYVAGGLVAVLALALALDSTVAHWARTWPDSSRAFFAAVTQIADGYWFLMPAFKLALLFAGLAFIIKDRLPRLMLFEQAQLWAFVFVGVGIPSLVAGILKRLIGRARPELLDTHGIFAFRSFAQQFAFEGFPSGHATTAFALAMVIGFLKPILLIPAAIVAVLVAISRIALEVHYPSDVVAGAICGVLACYAVRHLFAWRGWLFELRSDGTVRRKRFPATKALFNGQRDIEPGLRQDLP